MNGAALGKDVWDIISSEIDDEATRIQLAKTCKLLSSLIVPYEWYYNIRTIKGKNIRAHELKLDPILNIETPPLRLCKIILNISKYKNYFSGGYVFLIFDTSSNTSAIFCPEDPNFFLFLSVE